MSNDNVQQQGSEISSTLLLYWFCIVTFWLIFHKKNLLHFSPEKNRKWPSFCIVDNWKCAAENCCWLNYIMTFVQLQRACLYFPLSDSGGQKCHALFLSLKGFSLWLLQLLLFWLTDHSRLYTPPCPQGHMILLRSDLWPPVTCHLRLLWGHMSSGPTWHLGGLFLTARLQPAYWAEMGAKVKLLGEVLGTFRGFQSGTSQL